MWKKLISSEHNETGTKSGLYERWKKGKIALTEAMTVFQTLNHRIKIITIKSNIYLVPDSAVHIFTHYITQFPSSGKLWEGNMILKKIRQKQNKN